MIKLYESSTRWIEAFENFKRAMSNESMDLFLDIEHIGSISIKNMPASDIVDVQCAVTDFEKIN